MLIIEATARGTKVSILTDDYLNKQSAANTLKGIEKLEKAGANINIQPRIHDKIICVDDHTVVIGSFNWLSASRASYYAKEERSIVCKGGEQVYQEINKHWKRIEQGICE